jgi:MFS family permease
VKSTMNRDQKTQLAVIFATNIALEITFVTGNVAGPAFQRAFGLSDTQLGLVLGAIHLGLISIALIVGRFTRRYGPPSVLSVGVLGAAAASGIVIIAGGFAPLFLGLASLGIAAALITNANATFASEIAGDQVRRVMALASGLWFASSAISAPGIGAWLNLGRTLGLGVWSHRTAYALDVVMLLVCLVLVRRIVVPRHTAAGMGASNRGPAGGQGGGPAASIPGGPAAPKREAPAAPLGREWPWVPALGFLHGLFVIILLSWTNPMIQAKFGATDFQGGLGVGLVSLGIGGGRFLLASIRSTIDDRILLAGSGAVGGAFLLAALLAPTLAVTYVVLAVAGVACSLTFPAILSLTGTRFPRSRSQVFGFMEASISTAGLAGPAAVGLLADSGVAIWHAMIISPLAGLGLTFTSIAWLLRRPGSRPAV